MIGDTPRTIGELGREEALTISDIDEGVLQVHGDPPSKKADGVCRLIYENVNGLNNRMSNNSKLDKAREMIHDLEADIVAFNEHRMYLSHRSCINGFRKLFQGGETDLRAVASHNAHETTEEAILEGGTSLMVYGGLNDQYDPDRSGKDESSLGRWTTMCFRGTDGFTTRVVCGYNPCYSGNLANGTSYSQQKRFLLTQKHDRTCPRTKFRTDLIALLTEWCNQGDRLIVCMDANEHIYDKVLGKALTNIDGLALEEVVGTFTRERLGATYFRGSKPIDAVWASSDLTVVGACVMPCGYGIGDHRLFVVDFLTSSMVGVAPRKIVRPAARRLNTRIPKVAEAYVRDVENLIISHRLIERLGTAHESSKGDDWIASAINGIDVEGRDNMLAAEKRCRKIRSGVIPFSPTAVKWIRRLQVYRSLLQWKSGRIKNRGNLLRASRRLGIENPLRMSAEELRGRIKACQQHCESLKKTGWLVRRRHLQDGERNPRPYQTRT